jgi:threonine dehydratase
MIPMGMPSIDDIRQAAERIRPYVHRTPVIGSITLNERAGANVFFKCENFQKAGAFKTRGATNAVWLLSDAEARMGVITHSSGNHGAALALAARTRGIGATVVMPNTAPEVKKRAVDGYGARIVLCEPTQEARETTTQSIIDETGATLIHPYNDNRIIAGQGTAALELLLQAGELDVVMAPIGGGGMMSGASIVAKAHTPSIRTIAAEPLAADDAHRSLKAGKIVQAGNPQTIADGLLTSLGPKTFEVIQSYVDEILTVEEGAIIEAMRYVWERMKIIIEPSSAVPVAVLFKYPEVFKGRRVGIILTGGNVDLDHLPWKAPVAG